jgi:hypothetical protein
VHIVRRAADGKIIFVEKGNRRAGLQHILERDAGDFAGQGLSSDEIPDIVIKAVTEGTVVGYQRRCPIYETEIKGNRHRISVTVRSTDSAAASTSCHFHDRRRSTCGKPSD